MNDKQKMIEKLKTTWTAFGGLSKEEQDFLKGHAVSVVMVMKNGKLETCGAHVWAFDSCNCVYRLSPDFEPPEEYLLFNTRTKKCRTALSKELLVWAAWIEITPKQKDYLENKPEAEGGFEWVLKVPEKNEMYKTIVHRHNLFVHQASVCKGEVGGIRWVRVPVKAKGKWVEYPVYRKDYLWVCKVKHVVFPNEPFNIVQLPALVGFGGVQFEGQKYVEGWYSLGCVGYGSPTQSPVDFSSKPATPIKARFWVEG